MPIYIEFTTPRSKWALYSRIIRWVQKTSYSHVRLRFYYKKDAYVFEAIKGKVIFRHLKFDDLTNVQIVHKFKIHTTEEQAKQIYFECFQMQGIKYSFLQALGIGIANLLNLKQNPFPNNETAQICSETVYRVLKNTCNIDIVLDAERIGPKELYNAMVSAGMVTN